MLSGVLNSKRAIQVNIQIMRTFTKIREMLVAHKDSQKKIEDMEKKYDHQLKVVFDAIKRLMIPPENPDGLLGFKRRRSKLPTTPASQFPTESTPSE